MGFIVGYFFSKAYLQRSHVQYDRWYVYDTCLGKCLFCDNQDQENNEDIMDDQEAMVSSEDELKSDTIKNSEEVLVEIDSAENRVEEAVENVKREDLFYGKLAGFSDQKAAQRYTEKLIKRGYEVYVKKYSYKKKSSGPWKTWYQVVTPPLKKELVQEMVDYISAKDNLHDSVICRYEESLPS